MSDDDFDTKNLDKFIKAMKDELPRIYVGIMGAKTTRSSAGINNATVGLMHEVGTEHLPVRSFLRVPIATHLKSKMASSGAFDKDALAEVIRSKSVVPWLKKVGIIAEAIVAEGFASGGYGQWPAWKPGYKNNTGMLLVDTQQLRNSITSEVV